MNRIQWAGVTALALFATFGGDAEARDPNKVRCRAVSSDGARLDARYDSDRREFRAEFSVENASADHVDRWYEANRATRTNMTPFAPGDVLQVIVGGERVGSIVLDGGLKGALEFDEAASRRRGPGADGDQPFPANFPPFPPGTITQVGSLSCVGQKR